MRTVTISEVALIAYPTKKTSGPTRPRHPRQKGEAMTTYEPSTEEQPEQPAPPDPEPTDPQPQPGEPDKPSTDDED
jgi:hypothetical protein